MMRAQLLVDSKCALGEGATWCAASGRFYWTDIEGSRLWRYDPRDGGSESFAMPERLACFTPCADPRHMLLGLASRLAFLDLETGEIETITEVESALPTRLNDGRCDRKGRFVFGTKHDVDDAKPIGGFYRLNLDLSLERLPLGDCAISNSIAFSPDGAQMYYCDTPTRQIRVCDYPSFANDRVFADLSGEQGYPDGSIVDGDGGLWNAQWGGSCVVRYAPDGRETARVAVPASQTSCVAFGGPHLGTLYITTARIGLADAALQEELHAGGVYIATPAARGVAEPSFAGKA
jgi:L-arabinonolactonase